VDFFVNIKRLLVEDIGVHGVNHRPVASHWQTLSHNVVDYNFCNFTSQISN
jgi:hypothetical protein